MNEVTIIIGDVAAFALSLDDDAMQSAMHVVATSHSKTTTAITGSPENVGIVLDDLLSRSSPDGGWDQPRNWQQACKRAYDSASAQITKLGGIVKLTRSAIGTVRVTIEFPPKSDFTISNHGSVSLVTPLTADARDHLTSHVAADSLWHGVSLAVERRYVDDLVANLENDGYTIEGDSQRSHTRS